MTTLVVTDVIQGRIAEIRNFGAFVWLQNGKKGLVHISEISDNYVKDIHSAVKPNQKVKVKILSIQDDGRIELSIKQALNQDFTKPPKPDPREELRENVDMFLGEPPNINFRASIRRPDDFDSMLKHFKKNANESNLDVKRSIENKRGGPKKRR
ncbi:S1 RNA-binding domain-containing protein [bacterium]|nr:S1 RNA-binding domain-containing protein [bacterium]